MRFSDGDAEDSILAAPLTELRDAGYGELIPEAREYLLADGWHRHIPHTPRAIAMTFTYVLLHQQMTQAEIARDYGMTATTMYSTRNSLVADIATRPRAYSELWAAFTEEIDEHHALYPLKEDVLDAYRGSDVEDVVDAPDGGWS